MKDIRRNIKVLAFGFIGAFIFMMIYFTYSVSVYGQRWFSSSHNPRLASGKTNVIAGDIFDASGVVLAHTTDEGGREYNENASIRRAVSHVVGENTGLTTYGAESFLASYLLGFNTNFVERLYQSIAQSKRRGQDIVLTIDSQVQLEAYNLLGDRKGSVVVLNYKTGEIIAEVSKPTFDPHNLDGIALDSWANENGVLVNRALQGSYPPGSVFKMVTAAAMLENYPDAASQTYHCEGEYEVEGGGRVRCAKGEKHGTVDLNGAFSHSCNVAFAQMGEKLGKDKLIKTAQRMGFNEDFLFSDTILYESKFPSPESEYELAWASVGQGKVTVTPMHMALIAGAIANEGQMMEPRLLLGTRMLDGRITVEGKARTYKRIMEPQIAGDLRQLMLNAVQGGTGTKAVVSGYDVGGKTGTAEVSSSKSVSEHAWFAGFIDDPLHPLAIAVVIENGGSGPSAAAPVAASILKKAIERGY